MAHTDFQLPIPVDWQKFERICRDLWALIWEDPNTLLHGRTGQSQCGVDVYGRPKQKSDYAGVQCKKVTAPLTKGEIEAEVEQAKTFTPPLKELIIATTAPSDVNSQQVARDITAAHEEQGLFPVHVYGWGEVVTRLEQHQEVIHSHWPHLYDQSHSSPTDSPQISMRDSPVEQIKNTQVFADPQLLTDIHNKVSILLDQSSAQTGDLDSEIAAQLDQYRELLNSHQDATALALLQALRQRIWEQSSQRVRFRILTNIGSAHLHLGQEQKAAAYFREANEYDPTDEKSMCNFALAHLLLGDPASALTSITEAIKSYPQSGYARSILISASHQVNPEVDILSLIPASLHQNADVSFSISVALRKQGKPFEALDWISRAFDLEPRSPDVRNEFGTQLVELSLDDYHFGFEFPLQEEKLADHDKAISILSELWNEVRFSDVADRFAPTALNLSLALQVRSRPSEALLVLKELETAMPANADVRHRMAGILLSSGNITEAIDCLSRTDVEFEARQFLLAECHRINKKYDLALDAIESFLLEQHETQIQTAANAFKLELLYRARDLEQARDFFNKIHPDVSVLTEMSTIEREAGNLDRAAACTEKAIALPKGGISFEEKIILANHCHDQGLHDQAIALYRIIDLPHVDSPQLRRYIVSLLDTDRRNELSELLTVLPEEFLARKFYLQAAVNLNDRLGRTEECLRILGKGINAFPEDLQFIVFRLGILERLERTDELATALNALPDLSQAPPDIKIKIAHFLNRHSSVEEARELAYQAMRDAEGTDPQVEMAYQALFFLSSKSTDLDNPETVIPNSAVDLEYHGNRFRTVIIEENLELRPAKGEIAVDSPIAIATLGKKVGDEIEWAENPYQNEKAKVSAIRHKFILALHRSVEEFAQRYPADRGFIRLSIDPSKPINEGLSTITDIVGERHKQFSQAIEFYGKGIPISVLAKMLAASSLEVWSSFLQKPGIELVTCLGSNDERNTAIELASAVKGKVVCDGLTLYSLVQFKIHREVNAFLGPIGVTQSTLDTFRGLIRAKETLGAEGQKSVFVGDDGKLYRHEISPEEVSQGVDFLKSIVEWIDSECTILPAVPAKDFDHPDVRRIIDGMEDSSVDTLFAAHGTGGVLLSDDYYFRQLARAVFNIEGLWTQAAIIAVRQADGISKEKYSDSVIGLILAKQTFVTISAANMHWLAKEEFWMVTERLRTVFSQLGKEGAIRESSISVAVDFLILLYTERISRDGERRMAYAIFSGLTRDGRGNAVETLELVVQEFRVRTQHFFLLQRLIVDVRLWGQGHFLHG